MPKDRKPTKFGPKGKVKVGIVLREFKKGSLRSSSGEKVTDRKQAVAIALSEARKATRHGSR